MTINTNELEIDDMVFETSINKTSKYTKSLKTIIPFELTELLKIRDGDKLKWKKNEDNSMTVWNENSVKVKKPPKIKITT